MLEHFLDRDEVFQRLWHFETLDVQMTYMQEVICPFWFVIVSFWLGKFVFVVREDQVNTSRVDVHFLAKNWDSHGRALNMPAGSTFTPRRGPFGFVGFGGFPEGKVLLVFLFAFFVFLFFLGFSLFNSFELAVFELFSVGFDVKVYWSIGGICVTVGDDFFDECDDFRDVFGDSGDVIGDFNSE